MRFPGRFLEATEMRSRKRSGTAYVTTTAAMLDQEVGRVEAGIPTPA